MGVDSITFLNALEISCPSYTKADGTRPPCLSALASVVPCQDQGQRVTCCTHCFLQDRELQSHVHPPVSVFPTSPVPSKRPTTTDGWTDECPQITATEEESLAAPQGQPCGPHTLPIRKRVWKRLGRGGFYFRIPPAQRFHKAMLWGILDIFKFLNSSQNRSVK